MPMPRCRVGTWVLLAVPLAFLVVCFYLPLLQLLWDNLGPGRTGPVFLIARDAYFWHLVRITVKQASLSTVASVLLGLPLGYIMTHYRLPLPGLWRAVTIVPFVLPTIVVALGFILFFGHNGYFNQALAALTGTRLPVLYSLWAIVLAHAFYNAPVIARTTAVAWEAVDPAWEQAASTLGVGSWTTFRRVTWPLLLPAVASGALLVFILSFFSFPLVLALGGARYSTLEVEVFTQVRVLLNYSTGAALALIETVISLGLTYLYLRIEAVNRLRRRVNRKRPLPPLLRWHPGTALVLLYLALLAILYVGPIGAVLVDSLRSNDGKFTLAAYRFILQPQHAATVGDSPLGAVANSLRFACGAMALAVVLGAALALGLNRVGRRSARLWETAAMAPLAVSSVAFGFAVLRAFRVGLLGRLGVGAGMAIVAAHAVLGLPFVLRVLRPHFGSMDKSLSQAARSLGATAWQAFRRVELPLSSSALLAAAAFAYAMSVAEMSATIMLAHAGLTTMPLMVYHLVSARQFAAASAMAVLLMAVMAAVFTILELAGQRLVKLQAGSNEYVPEF